MAQVIQMKRQQEQDRLAQALGQANIGHLNAETSHLAQPADDWEKVDTSDGIMLRNKRTGEAKPFTKPDGTAYQPADKSYAPIPTTSGYVTRDGKPVLGQNGRPLMPPSTVPGNVFVTGTGADGKPAIFEGQNKGPGALHDTGVGKPAAAGAGGGSLSTDDRQKMVSQAKIDNEEMKRIEARVLRGELQFGTVAGLAGAASQAHGGPLNEMVGVLGNAAAGAVDPDIQKYFTAQSSYGRIMGNLQSKRYTDHQAEIEKRISGMQGNDLSNTINYKQQLRDASLADPTITPHASPASPSSGNVDLRTPHGKTFTYGGKTYPLP
jgi:hypothetical protein